MSRFFLITAQTREFPTILVMISTDVTTVPAISADSDMTMSVLVTITESIMYIKKMNTYFAVDLFRTLYIKRKTIGRPAHPHLESLRQSRDCKGTFERKKALHALYTRGSASRQRLQRRSKIIERVSSQFFPLVFLFTKYLCYHVIQVDKMYQISK